MRLLPFLLAGGVVLTVSAENVSRQNAEVFQKKVAVIQQQGETKAARERQTTLTQDEVNSYLRYGAGEQLPVGVTEPTIGIHEQGRLTGRAIVDLNVVRQKRGTGGWFDPLTYLSGRLPLTASGVLQTQDGKGRFVLDTAAVSGVPIPKAFLQDIVSFYSRSEDFPNGINIDEPFTLPAEIRRIDVAPGRAVVVQ
jgi:hypothetical protein